MPRGDKTGPDGKGPATGRGRGGCKPKGGASNTDNRRSPSEGLQRRRRPRDGRGRGRGGRGRGR